MNDHSFPRLFRLTALPCIAIMVEPQNITELARQIKEAAEVVSAFAQKHNVKFSFGPQDPDPASLCEGTQSYHQARLAIIEASSRLKSLLSGDVAPFFSLHCHV